MSHCITVLVGSVPTMIAGTTHYEGLVAVACNHPDLAILPITDKFQRNLGWPDFFEPALSIDRYWFDEEGEYHEYGRVPGLCRGTCRLGREISRHGLVALLVTMVCIEDFAQGSAVWNRGEKVQPAIYFHDWNAHGTPWEDPVFAYAPGLPHPEMIPGCGGFPVNFALRHFGLTSRWEPPQEPGGPPREIDAFDQVGLGVMRDSEGWLTTGYLRSNGDVPRQAWAGGKSRSVDELLAMGLIRDAAH